MVTTSRNPNSTKITPFLSIIIATRNEEKYIGKLLESISKQTFPKDKLEVLVVDGLSTDFTLQIARKYAKELNLRTFTNPKVRAPSAFNIGISEAKGDYFMVVGAHSFLNKDFVEKSVDTFLETIKREPKLIGVGGVCVTEYENRLGELVGLVYSSFFSGARSCRYRKDGHFSDSVIFGLFNRNEVIKNGCFDEDFLAAGDDDELTIRLHNRGYKFFTNPDILSHYYVRNSLGKFITQTYNYGVAKGFMVRKGLNKIEPFNSASLWFVPAGFLIYEILLLLALGVFGISWSLALALVPFISYWLAVIGISLLLYKRTKSRLCFLLPFTYFLFHNILGLSSILGLLLKGKAFR